MTRPLHPEFFKTRFITPTRYYETNNLLINSLNTCKHVI